MFGTKARTLLICLCRIMKNTQTIGAWGENLARDFLIKRSYKIIGQNERLGHKEIDLIALQAQETVFIEVKTRLAGSLALAEEQINHQKIKKLKSALCAYCIQNKIPLTSARLDLIAININKGQKMAKIKHFKNIF
jgi:putative endonuclease